MMRRPRSLAALVCGVAACALVAACSHDAPQLAAPQPTIAAAAASSTSTSTTTTTRPLRAFTVAASGDILLHNPVIQRGAANANGNGFDFSPMFDDVRPLLQRADLAICHMETPISADDTALTVPRTLSFNAPREIVDAIVGAGFDGCDNASNHIYDRGLAGINATLEVLDAAGLKHAGTSRNPMEAATPPIHDVNGVKVGHLAYSYTLYNEAGPNDHVPPDTPWLRAMLWPAIGVDGIREQARALRAQGAEFIVVSMHWGNQYVHQPTTEQREYARALLASPDVDLILGDHVHVVQPCEKVNGKYVAYGMGNFLSNQSPTQDATLTNDNQDGSIVWFSVSETSPGVWTTKMQVAPTWVTIPSYRIERATPEVHGDSYARTMATIGSLGADACDATALP